MPLITNLSPNRFPINQPTTGERVYFEGGPFTGVTLVYMMRVGVQGQYLVNPYVESPNRMWVVVPPFPVPAQFWFRLYFGASSDDNLNMRLRFEAPAPSPPPQWPCEREAWLTLGDKSIPLEDDEAGYVCSELDIGWPAMREVVNNRPDQHGIDDRTKLFGSRVVTAHIVAGHGGSQEPDQITRLFAPFFLPDARPVLHWRMNSPNDGYAERTLQLRASEFSAPIAGAATRDFHLAWVTPDPYIYDPVVKQSISKWGSSVQAGRTYPLRFDRWYPLGTAPPVTGQLRNAGDAYAFPNLRIYGPIDGPDFQMTTTDQEGQIVSGRMAFVPTFRIDPGRYVEINSRDHTAIADDGRRVESQLNWSYTTGWPIIPPHNRTGYLSCLFPRNTNHISQIVTTWQDAYLAP